MAEVEQGRPEEGLHAWVPGTARTWQVVDWCDPHDGRLLVADSWRVIDGMARGLGHHRARFLAGVAIQCPDKVDAAARFVDDAIAALPRHGDWFPRIELRTRDGEDGAQWWLRLRPTPPPSTDVVVATAPRDVRTQPLVKGPDLDALLSLRTAVQPLGAGEAVILDADGHLVEGAYSGLLWWHDGVLVRPADTLPRIASVTVDLVLDAARAAGVPLSQRRARPEELEGCEVWVLSALHGLRVATAWVDGPTLTPGDRAAEGRAWLAAAAAALPSS
ncbi:aminotransferase class IV [Microcella sp.]|uniref:aminotransferase class IV n=1 Tax=Microcella sp. TaxID=1913979 RepID=UPI002560C655|nr:aminotransferase class IV [Microcella sp.]MBX9471039.1 aminotransferase class IV [Microcella sp.]